MVSFEVLMKATAVTVTAVFSLLVLRGDHRRPANQFLAFFLLLIAGNQTAEMIRSIGVSPAWDRLLFRAAAVFASLDPFFLYYFASIHPERNVLNRPRYVAGVGLACFLMLLAVPLRRIVVGGGGGVVGLGAWLNTYWAVATAVIYTVVLAYVTYRLLHEERGEEERFLFLALSAAVVPAVFRTAVTLGPIRAVLGRQGSQLFLLTMTGLLLAGLVYLVVLLSRRAGRDRRTRRTLTWGLAIGGLLGVTVISSGLASFLQFQVGVGGSADIGRVVRQSSAALRWVLFSVFASMAVLRTQMLGQRLTQRRRAARVLVALGFLGAGGFLLLASQGLLAGNLQLRSFDIVVLGLVVAVSQGFKRTRDRVAEVVYGVPMPGDPQAAMQAYREALEEAVEEGRGLDDPELERLREELGLDEGTARTLEEAVASSVPDRLDQGITLAGRYTVGRRLGRGAAGRVFLAHDELLDRDVVLKEIAHEDEQLQETAVQEARLSGSLQHPNVITVHDVVERPDVTVLVTEFAPGGSLADRMDEDGGSLGVEEGVRLIDGLLAALQAAHEEGIVHRDVKPSNVLLSAGDRPMLADFGVARLRTGQTETMATAEVLAGTPEFMAPEQKRGEIATEATDIYAVGLVMDRLLAGPLPNQLAEVRDKALREDPSERWGSAEEMRLALERGSRIDEGP